MALKLAERVATFIGKPGNLEKSGKHKMIREKSGIYQKSQGKVGKFVRGKLP
jgi:hypothetical protein